MRQILLVGIAALTITGCAKLNNPTPARSVFELRSTYDATVLAPASAYAQLPLCSAQQAPPCVQPNILQQIAKANHSAIIALDNAEYVARGQKVGNADEALRIAEKAVTTASDILQQYGLATGKQ